MTNNLTRREPKNKLLRQNRILSAKEELMSRPLAQRARRVGLSVEQLETRTLLSANMTPSIHPLDLTSPEPPLTPAQVRHYYGFDQVTFKSGTTTVQGDGSGQ